MQLSRRSLLAGSLAAGLGVLATPALAKPIPPKLWGDGWHDDTAALQWRVDEAAREGTFCQIFGGRHLISGALVLRGSGHCIDTHFLIAPEETLFALTGDVTEGHWVFQGVCWTLAMQNMRLEAPTASWRDCVVQYA